jgi:hypothetical protein
MKNDEIIPFTAVEEEEQCRPLTVLSLYEDEETRIVAEAVCQRLMQELEPDFQFDCLWCGLADLMETDVAREATLNATDADLVIFSTHAEARPSPALKRWVETWQQAKAQQDCALVALIAEDTNQKRTSQFRAFLQEVATRAHMDFLFHVIRLPVNRGGGLDFGLSGGAVKLPGGRGIFPESLTP